MKRRFCVVNCATIALCIDPFRGGSAALWLISWRLVQGIGGAMLFANSTAILTDSFPRNDVDLHWGHPWWCASRNQLEGCLPRIGVIWNHWHNLVVVLTARSGKEESEAH